MLSAIVSLLVSVVLGLAGVFSGIIVVLRTLWNIRGAWDRTNSELHNLVDDVKELVVEKEKEHTQIRADIDARQLRADGEHRDMRERLTWLERWELEKRRKEDGT